MELKLEKADKGTTKVIMNKTGKIKEVQVQLGKDSTDYVYYLDITLFLWYQRYHYCWRDLRDEIQELKL